MRLALEELGRSLPEKARPDFWPLLWERYVENKLDYKSSPELLQGKRVQAGQDCLCLLQWLESKGADLRYGRQVELLQEGFAQQFELKDNRPEPVKQHAAGVVQSPHDPDAQWSAKGQGQHKKSWVGYKVQVAETLAEASSPSFVVSMVTQKAIESDGPGLDQTLADQARSGLERPNELYADSAYISAPRLQQASQEGWSLMGPAASSPRPPGGERFGAEAFDVDIAHRTARCPAGQPSGHCSQIREKARAKVFYRFEWRRTVCQRCPLQEACVSTGQTHRTLVGGQYHELLQQRRREQGTEAFREKMHRRNAIEATLSELARGHGLRRSRYRGFAKVELQNLLIGTACNVKRWLRVIAPAEGVQTRAFELVRTLQGLTGRICRVLHVLFSPKFGHNGIGFCFASL